MPKYHNVPCVVNGIQFDSMAEGRRYRELLLLEKAGDISSLEVHPDFVLQERYRKAGKIVRCIAYEGDFSYREAGRLIVEDVKGVETAVFRLKRKMFEYKYPDVELRVIK